ncbi:MAG: indole-3-glycerol phosphate synthase TrpC [Capsulimonadaceae bacterium]
MSEPTVLDTILAHKRTEVDARRAVVPLAEVKARAKDAPPARPFATALHRPSTALIAEVKKASPSAGVIRADFDPVSIAREYESSGAACLSVLTDERFFQGHDNYLGAIRSTVRLPLLRKDFTVDEYQVYEARAIGADAILLIAAALDPDEVADLHGIAHSVGLDILVEVHNEMEMEVATGCGAYLIGINSRDLHTFVTDLATVERLAPLAPPGVTLVAESGIKTPADVARVSAAGAHAILVGESLMRQPDIASAVLQLMAR